MKRNKILYLFGLLVFVQIHLYAATGCDLNDPDRDVKRFFPNSTSYKTAYVNIKSKGGTKLLNAIETKLGDKFTGAYETMDVPYTMYTIYKNKEVIGYIHGVNQKGHYGGIQVFLAANQDGIIQNFYIQKMTSPTAKLWRDNKFSSQFKNLSLNDFKDYDPKHKIESFKNIKHSDKNNDDFNIILRAVKKNLILMDEFLWNNKFWK